MKRAAAAALALLLLACTAPQQRLPRLPSRVPGARLLVVIVVDQLGWDTLVRYRPALRGGLARLLDEGVVFRQCYHRHAETATGPGHATLVTGMTPRHHGIVGNQWFDRRTRREVYSAQDPRTGVRAPANLLTSALGDWVRQRDPWGKSFAASGKDRAAVLMGGKRSDGAYWYDDQNGGFTSSKAYGPLPVWVKSFDRQPVLRDLFGTTWRPLPLPPHVDAGALGVLQLQGASASPPFPHAYGKLGTRLDQSFYSALFDTPAIDGYLASFARELISRQRLGRDDHLDYLALSFSGLDSVGHQYGPHSREELDTLVRLDRSLGELLDFLAAKVGKDRLVVALSGDHGVAPMPERQRRLGLPGTRVNANDIACVQSVGKRLDAAYGHRDWFAYDLYLDPVAVYASRARRADIDRRVVRWLQGCPDVAHVWTRAQLLPDAHSRDPMLTLYRASFHPLRSGDYALQWKPYFVSTAAGTTHHSPYAYDTHVPLVLLVPGIEPRTIDAPVATVDLAATLAGLLGLRPPQKLDGDDLTPLILPATASPRAGR